ncbi:hypothetical protein Hanom_Chr06g00537121 [Helianthus anomalus]
MWYPQKIHSHPELTSCGFGFAYQISGQNFFQVRDDVTTQDFKSVQSCISCVTILF